MNASSRWPLTNIEQEKLVHNLTINLPLLRAKLGISQDEISKIIGVSRQTYSAIESGKRPMSWQVYLSLVLFFDTNKMTRDLLHHLECFPDLLVDRTTITEDEPHQNPVDIDADILQMLTKLDDQALRSVKTVLMVEYARCSKIPGEAVVKAFDGSQFTGSLTTRDVELANANQQVKMRMDTDESQRDSSTGKRNLLSLLSQAGRSADIPSDHSGTVYTIIELDPYSADKDSNFIISRLDLGDMVFRRNGFTYADMEYRFVFVNKELNENEKKLVLAHEMGYIVCGHFTHAPILGNSVIEEGEANQFAHYMLYLRTLDWSRIRLALFKNKF